MGFLWAGDYIQTVRRPTLYARDVARAVWRVGLQPRAAGAQHLEVTPWEAVGEVLGY